MWDIFKKQVKLVMESPPSSLDDVAKAIAVSYDTVIKLPPAGDIMNKNPVLAGNVVLLENLIKSALLQQSVSPIQLPILDAFQNALIAYWGGASLQPLFPPLIPVPGAISNLLPVVQVMVTNPGIQLSYPFTYEGLDNVDGFIDKFITIANLHLATVGGNIFTTAIFPGGVTAVGFTVWNGYSMTGNEADFQALNPLQFAADAQALERLKKLFSGTVEADALRQQLQLKADEAISSIGAMTGEGGAAPSALSDSTSAFISDTPWSAAFISYVMRKAGVNFPSRAAHTQYLNALKTYSNFELLDPDKTKIRVGDLVVFNRQGNNQTWKRQPWSGFSHGDIIVSVSAKSAEGVGGNVGNTVSKKTFYLDNDIISNKDVFAIARPLQQQDSIVNTALGEYNIWKSNNWKELDAVAFPKLSEYYKTVGINLTA